MCKTNQPKQITMVRVRKRAQLTGHNAAIFAIGPDVVPHQFLSAAGDGWIVRWDLKDPDTGRLIAKIDTQAFSLLYLEEANRVVVGNMNGGVHWVDLDNPEHTRNIAHHQKGVFGLHRVGDFVYSIGGGGMLTRWDLHTARSLESVRLANQPLRCIAYSADRRELAVGSSDNSIYLLDADTLQVRHRHQQAHDNSVFTIAYHPDGQHLLSGGRDAHLRIWHFDADHQLRAVAAKPAHWFTINAIALDPQERWFATGSRDKTIKLWDAHTFELVKVLETARDGCHVNSVNRLFWSPFQNELISASDDRSMIIWTVDEA